MGNISVIWKYAVPTTDQLASPSCQITIIPTKKTMDLTANLLRLTGISFNCLMLQYPLNVVKVIESGTRLCRAQ